ncbi:MULTISPECIES: energy-coupling factor ABC transporter ATP-binding protein [Rhizobium]|uniref:ABC transporter ATP-binding protein n=1 Tax=Rhizobium rhododendri TaxID=2506430 RepID=A0ABY8IJU4_9HYPH|nr:MULTISPECIES: ABC transporter ATP-binding protein [Rhizobium]MBZ5761051.1 energy-coupling factor ABC transporter ATP-binding protein [Rhizobium sp. VS19-DR96]MBZ5767261.1 energy-coupling factor ABC transporter ATP-binding protein [Rhizobium sp. VS19-DR129.2]MBZ5773450.1 energy-coupling factor ABC transporter ATP-binding protein [Rhizobium sp. VS19-DRK62.2]MBZ5785573.1 energy-coupling factor ABC transporter ATP-binding protein [Rhizobium sp. VS19-DR121]MBZ5802394.1 energy-coupling factor ABC
MDIRFEQAGLRFGQQVALQPFSVTLIERRVGIIGLNGSGKSSFARMINGLAKPTTGRVVVDGLDTVADAKAVLGKVGFIFQSPQNQIILPVVRDDIALGLKNRGLGKPEIAAAVDAVLDRLDARHLADRRAHELSGGELQLAALCSVLVTGPDILILDEPTNQLDLRNRGRVERMIGELPENVIVISHDLELIENFERVLLFDKGRLVAEGSPGDSIALYREIAR